MDFVYKNCSFLRKKSQNCVIANKRLADTVLSEFEIRYLKHTLENNVLE